ncbi:hypothetical protein [Helicobacter bizzozeronii]|nr:hypothetical protein [Helicobacter bizzozeronii]
MVLLSRMPLAIPLGFLTAFSVSGCLQPEHCQIIFDAIKHITRHVCQ